jgi:general secretion pathway protein G
MKRGFTMIELVFVIVILGILASIAIPRLAASRDDASAVSLKQDIGTLIQAVPAWYQGQREISIENAAGIDLKQWEPQSNLVYKYNDGRDGNITISLVSAPIRSEAKNIVDGVTQTKTITTTNNAVGIDSIPDGEEPWLVIKVEPMKDGIVRSLVDMNVTSQAVPMAGRRVVWN